jgi:AcrR family transcriptional regulator
MTTEEKCGTRERILEEARKLFAERGFWGTSVQEITDAAKVNKAMLFYYFKSKENLYHSLLLELMDSVDRMMETRLAPGKSPLDKLKAIMDTFDELFEPRNFSLFKICFQDIMGPGGSIKESLRGHIMKVNNRIACIIDEGISQGVFRPLESRTVALSIMGILYIFARHRIVMGESSITENISSYFYTFILEGIRA